MTRFPKLAGLAEIAGLAGVSRQRASQLASHPDFPKPVDRLAMGPVWREDDIKMFLTIERKPGRRPRPARELPRTVTEAEKADEDAHRERAKSAARKKCEHRINVGAYCRICDKIKER